MPPADHRIECLVVAGLGFSAFQCKFGVTVKPGGGSTTGRLTVRSVSHKCLDPDSSYQNRFIDWLVWLFESRQARRTPTAILFPLLWRKLHRFHDRYSFPIEHLPRIPNEGRMKEALCRALFGKGFDSGLSGGFAPHESSVRRICNCRIASMRL
jgi:hypothetical protein